MSSTKRPPTPPSPRIISLPPRTASPDVREDSGSGKNSAQVKLKVGMSTTTRPPPPPPPPPRIIKMPPITDKA